MTRSKLISVSSEARLARLARLIRRFDLRMHVERYDDGALAYVDVATRDFVREYYNNGGTWDYC